ncbi:MAG: SoxY-related AACIE arm protein [Burkholderiales bacterium]|nr:SoxY-related AACIE arm protein [Burkholderiales bacterium]
MAANTAIARRTALRAAAGAALMFALRPVNAAIATAPILGELAFAYAGPKATLREARVKLDITPLVENGNSVPVTISVDSPMTANEHVVGIALFSEKNPQNDVALFALTPLSGRAQVSTRIRLATSQQLMAVAKMNDGSCWSHTVEVVVTTASCVEE